MNNYRTIAMCGKGDVGKTTTAALMVKDMASMCRPLTSGARPLYV